MKRIFLFTLALLFCFSCVMSVSYAAEPYPPLSDISVFGDAEEYVIYRLKNTDSYGNPFYIYTVTLLNDHYDYINTENAKFEIIINHDNIPVVYLRNSDGAAKNFLFSSYQFQEGSSSWSQVSKNTTVNSQKLTSINGTNTEYYYSTLDIEYSDGTVFFPPPPTELYQIIQGVTKEELQIQKLTLAGTMRTLTVCGIGLLALLIGLVLFGKVFRIFQVK